MNKITFKNDINIWTPSFVLERTRDEYITGWNLNRHLTVAKEQKLCPLYPKAHLENGRKCNGRENTLKVKQYYVKDFLCTFSLGRYPFDSQTCSMVIRTSGFTGKYVVIDNSSTLTNRMEDFKSGYFVQPQAMECMHCDAENKVGVLSSLLLSFIDLKLHHRKQAVM